MPQRRPLGWDGRPAGPGRPRRVPTGMRACAGLLRRRRPAAGLSAGPAATAGSPASRPRPAHPVTAYVTNWGSGTVTPIRTATNKAGRAIKIGTLPDAIAITPDGKTAYVSRGRAGRLTDRIRARPVVLAGHGRHARLRPGGWANQRDPAQPQPRRPRSGPRRGDHPDHGRRLPGPAARPGTARQQRHPDHAASRRVVRHRHPRHDPADPARRAPGRRRGGRATAFDNAFWWSLGLTALAVIPALALPGRPDRSRRPRQPGSAARPARPPGGSGPTCSGAIRSSGRWQPGR